MHELAICQALLEQVADVARENDAQRVARIEVHVGPLSGVEVPLLERAFSIARAGTVAEEARLETVSLPVRVRCEQCGQESEARVNRLVCGHCGDYHTRLCSGDELILARVELLREESVALAV
ncbi:MAG: hydrogenase maturation nickel metallochaperone HypA [Gammaproteobacteria bacterium]|jgi:hydrogenase nickel incorporation protein HypA/HybF|nr:hydrogenase maturation nickel metallochaperone HypA [Gammaproteobacteria bacterium]